MLSFSRRRFLRSVAAVLTFTAVGFFTPHARAADPTLSITGGLTEIEGNTDFGNPVSFSVNLSAASAQTVTVNVSTADGTAKAPADYSATNLTLSFAPGETTQSFTVPVVGDTLDENAETFYVFLSQPANATIAQGRGTGTIFNDDSPSDISIENVSIGEGNSGQRVAAFRLSLSKPSGKVVRVNYETTDVSAVSGSDYVAVTPTSVAFSIGSTVAYARVYINGDTLNEGNEAFYVNLSGPQNATINGSTTGTAKAACTILNDDRAPALSVSDVTVTEGSSGTKVFAFTISLSAPSSLTISANYTTADGIAVAPADYTAKRGTLSFRPGQTSIPVNVVVVSDTIVEPDEAFYLLLSNPVNASIGRGRGIGTIVNDDTSG